MQYSTDAHRHSSQLWRLDAELPSVVPRGGAWWSHCHPLYRLSAKQTLSAIVAFHLFIKVKTLLWLLSVNENKY